MPDAILAPEDKASAFPLAHNCGAFPRNRGDDLTPATQVRRLGIRFDPRKTGFAIVALGPGIDPALETTGADTPNVAPYSQDREDQKWIFRS
jgi:hypothetical protein